MLRSTSTRLLARPDGQRAGGGEKPTEPRPQLGGSGALPADQGPHCSCGHGKRAHEHYRKGSDCALCDCLRFRRRGFIRLWSR